MRTYQNISNPTIGDILQALEGEDQGYGTVTDLTYLVTDRGRYPTLYVVMDYLEDQGQDIGLG